MQRYGYADNQYFTRLWSLPRLPPVWEGFILGIPVYKRSKEKRKKKQRNNHRENWGCIKWTSWNAKYETVAPLFNEPCLVLLHHSNRPILWANYSPSMICVVILTFALCYGMHSVAEREFPAENTNLVEYRYLLFKKLSPEKFTWHIQSPNFIKGSLETVYWEVL